MAFVSVDRKSSVFSTRQRVICNDVIVVVMVTLTLMTSLSANAAAAGNSDVDRQSRDHHGGRVAVTWYDDVTGYRYNTILQRDDPKVGEVCYYYYYY